MLYIKQPDPLAALPGLASSAFSQGMKDAQVQKAFKDELVLRGFEMGPDGMTPEEAQKEGYQQTSYGFVRKKAPESSVEWLGKGGLGTGAPPGVATKTRGVTTGFDPGPQEKDAWMTELGTGAKFQVPRSEAADMMGLSPDKYIRGQVPKKDKPERLYETDEGFLARDQAIGKKKKPEMSALRKRFDEYKAANPDYKGKVLDYLKLEKEAEKTGKGLQRKTRTRRLESGAVETQEYDYDPNAGEEVGESSPWVTTGKESDPGVSKRREFLTAKDLAKAEETILENPERESVTGHIELFNGSSETPYMYIWGDVPGTIYGTNPGTQRIDLPKMNGRQVTAADVMKTAEEEGMTPEEVLIHIGVIEQEDGT